MSFGGATDPYIDPHTGTLRNKLKIKDTAELQETEEFLTSTRLNELVEQPLPGDFDCDHMKALHRYIFQDLYDWAGEERTWPINAFMMKSGPDVVGRTNQPQNYPYYPANRIADNAPREYQLLRQEILQPHSAGTLDPETFITELADRWAEINSLHSFREGNTRTQFVFFSQLCNHCEYELRPALFAPGGDLRIPFIHARFHAQATGTSEELRKVLGAAITPLGRNRQPTQIQLANSLAEQATELAPAQST